MATSKKQLKLPEPIGIKPLEIDPTSIYLRWAILSSHDLTKQQLINLQFEFRTTDNKLLADCTDNKPAHEYKARLCGLSENTKYRFQVRSKLTLKSTETITSPWSNRLEITTSPKMDHFVIISDEKELQIQSLKHRLRRYMDENKKLQLQIQQLQLKLNESSKQVQPGHWNWDYKKIANWIMRIQDGAFKQYKKSLTKTLKEEGITGKDLVMVHESNLREWGITNFNSRKVLMQYIKRLTENDQQLKIEYDPSLTEQLSEPLNESSGSSKKDKEKDQEMEKKQTDNEQHVQQKEKIKGDNEEKKAPELPSRVGGISQSVQALLEDANSERQKMWRYREGMLSVLVVKATKVDNLDKHDWLASSASRDASDPYVELDLKGNYKKEKTQSIENNENPIWNERFQLFVDDAKNDVLKCRLYDHDKFAKDDKIGTVEIPIITVLGANGYVRKEFDVIGSKTGCKLELELKYWESMR